MLQLYKKVNSTKRKVLLEAVYTYNFAYDSVYDLLPNC
jgi:hypothetical protein